MLSDTHQYELSIGLWVLYEDSYEVQDVNTAVTIVRLYWDLGWRYICALTESFSISTHQGGLGYGCPGLFEVFLVFCLERKICSQRVGRLSMLTSQ